MHRILILFVLALALTSCATKLPHQQYTWFAQMDAGAQYCAYKGEVSQATLAEFNSIMSQQLNAYSYDLDKFSDEFYTQIARVENGEVENFTCSYMSQRIQDTIAEHRANNSSTGNMMVTNQLMLLNLAQQQPPQYNYEPMNLPTPNYNTGGNSEYYTIRGPNGTKRCTTTPSGIIHCF